LLLAPVLGCSTAVEDRGIFLQRLADELEALKRGQQELLQEVRELKGMIRSRTAPSGPPIEGRIFDLGENPIKGDPAARLTLIEFSDYQCPYCARHVRQTLPQLDREFISQGRLRYAFLDLPLERLHSLAFKAAEAAHCAGEQGKYWEMHDRLFAHQQSLEPWSGHAQALELDPVRFEVCMREGGFAAGIRRDMGEASKAGITGTPSFVLGLAEEGDPTKVRALTLLRGAQPFAAFQAQIEKALRTESE
jgi:protein-disulfide isomerase